MFSIWGKVTSSSPLPIGQNDEKRLESSTYYYTSSAGQIVSSDGNAYAIPSLYSNLQSAMVDRKDASKIGRNNDDGVDSSAKDILATADEEKRPVIETDSFIPISFAQKKLKQLSEELTICKENYQAKLQALQLQHANNMV